MRHVFLFGCLISGFLFAQTADTCLSLLPRHIVVIGSSTAAGVGPNDPDSAWVPRFLRSLQAYSPAYRVSNLAKGGYQTFHLMPDNFQPQPGHPMPDSSRNISHALRLDPDAIIINLPSNDASALVEADTQMQNFRMMSQLAEEAGVPVWVCTPQPRDFDSAMVAIQWALLDSIEQEYGDRSIDFWRVFADEEGLPLAKFDSGDGIHLNDEGHRILHQRILGADIPVSLLAADSMLKTRLQLLGELPLCALEEEGLRFRAVSLGRAIKGRLVIEWQKEDTLQKQFVNVSLLACEPQTFTADLNLPGGKWKGKAWLESLENQSDTLQWEVDLLEAPDPLEILDSLPFVAGKVPKANDLNEPKTFWYESPSAQKPLFKGLNSERPSPEQGRTWWVEAVLGPLTQAAQLTTTDRFDRDANGVMFDLVASKDITLDSLALGLSFRGEQTVVIWSRLGTHCGQEQQPNSWQKWDSVPVVSEAGWTWVGLNPKPLLAGDTLGVYVHLADPSHRLRYDAVAEPQVFATDELSMRSGTSVSHAFGAFYFPRVPNLKVAYHFGEAYCRSERVKVEQ